MPPLEQLQALYRKQGWNDPSSINADIQAGGWQGKANGQQLPMQGQVLGAQTGPQQGGFMQQAGNMMNGAYDWATQQAQNVSNAVLPVAAPITQQFGIKSPYDVFSGGVNTGTDFAVPQGTPVIVPSGRWRVVSAFNQAQGPGYIGNNTNNGYGNSIMVQNMDSGERLRFSHLSKVGVRPGDIVGGGVVGLSGSTGNASGPHLDLEYYDSKGKLGDPLKSPFMQQKMMAMGKVTPQTFEPPKPKEGPDGTQQAAEKPNPYHQNIELTKMFLGPKSRVTTQPSQPQQQINPVQNPYEPGVPLT